MSELAAIEFLESKRWGDSPACVHCGDVNVYQMKDRATGERNKRFLWRCRGCGKQYTVRIGTAFEESLVPLDKWLLAFEDAAAHTRWPSTAHLSRLCGVSYKTAIRMDVVMRDAAADLVRILGSAPSLATPLPTTDHPMLRLDASKIAALMRETNEVQNILHDAMRGLPVRTR